jgi:putative transcriptional regulator
LLEQHQIYKYNEVAKEEIIMFQENLKALRIKKGMTQKELATRLNVVRQTISKWEKGLSVPDSELLIKLAEILEVSVSQLLGSKIEIEEKPDALAEQLSRINEQLAIKNSRAKKVWKVIAFIIFGIIIAYVFSYDI